MIVTFTYFLALLFCQIPIVYTRRNVSVGYKDKLIEYSTPAEDWFILDDGGKDGSHKRTFGGEKAAYALFNFSGVAFYYMSSKWCCHGETIINMTVDGVSLAPVNLQSNGETWVTKSSVVTGIANLNNQMHTVRISPGTPLSSVVVDYLIYTVLEAKDLNSSTKDDGNQPPSSIDPLSSKLRGLIIAMGVISTVLGALLVWLIWRCINKSVKPSTPPEPPPLPRPRTPIQVGPAWREIPAQYPPFSYAMDDRRPRGQYGE